MEKYFAHRTQDGRKQSVYDHLCGCGVLAAKFASAFGAEEFGRLAGMMHDIGKYSEAFQRRLDGGPKVDHSSAGTLECALAEQFLVGICIAGHHGGLPDYGNERIDRAGDGTFVGRLKKAFPLRGEACPGWDGKMPETPAPQQFDNDYALSFWIRMYNNSFNLRRKNSMA